MKKEKILDSISSILILFTFILYYGYNSLKYGSISVYYIPIFALFAISIIKFLVLGKIKIGNWKNLWWYLLFLIYGCLSVIWSINISFSITVLIRVFVCFIFIFDLTIYIDSDKKIKNVMLFYIIGLIFMITRLLLFESGRRYYYGDVIGFYRNSIAHSLDFGIIFLFYFFSKDKKKIYILLMLVFFYFIYKTGSRKGFLFPILFITIVLLLSTGKNIKKILKNIIIVCGIIIAIMAILFSNELFKKRMTELFQSFQGKNVEDESVIEREYYRKEAIYIFSQNPILGNGIFGFAAYMASIGYSHIAYCHSNWFELLSTLGLVGFLIYYRQYFRIVKKAISFFKSNNVETMLPLVAISLLFVFEYGVVTYYDIHIQTAILIMYMMLYYYERNFDNESNKKNI